MSSGTTATYSGALSAGSLTVTNALGAGSIITGPLTATSGTLTGMTGAFSTLTASNFSSGNVLATGGSITNVSGQFNTLATTNFSSGNVLITGGSITGTNGAFTTLTATNFSSANAVSITGASIGTAIVTNLSSGNAVITGGSVTGVNGAATTFIATNFTSGNATLTGTLTGTAATSNVALYTKRTATTTNASYYVNLTDTNVTGNTSVFVGPGLTFNPSTNNISTTTFTGSFSGTASITSGSITGATGQFSTLTATNLSSGNLQVSGAITPNANATINLGSATAWFNTIYGVSSQAKYADLAEVYTSDEQYAPGTVVVFGVDTEVTISKTLADNRVAGVVSTNPAYLMNAEGQGVAVALTGRVPCHVVGKITRGDMLVTSAIPGVATYVGVPQIGTVIGKALDNYDSNDIGVIEVVVGRL